MAWAMGILLHLYLYLVNMTCTLHSRHMQVCVQITCVKCARKNCLRRGVRSDTQLVAQRPDFKSAVRVVKMVLNSQCYQYLWLTMWFHAKKSKETLKKSKSLILQCKFGSRAQKWPKNAQKTDHSIAIYSIFLYRYGIFWMSPGESSHPGGSEYVWRERNWHKQLNVFAILWTV